MRFLFFCPYGSYRVHNQVDAVLGLALHARGHQTLVAICDGLLRDCEVLHWEPLAKRAIGCQTCKNTGKEFFELFAQPTVNISSYLTSQDNFEIANWITQIQEKKLAEIFFRDIPLGNYTTSSIITCFKSSVSELDRPDIRQLHLTYLRNGALIALAVQRAIDTFKPDRLICFNARMYPFRIASEIAQRKGLNVLIHERGNSDNRFNFTVNHKTYDSSEIVKYAKLWMDTPLTAEEARRVISHYQARELGKDANLPGFHTVKGRPETLRARLNIPVDAKITGWFTSSEFELNEYDGFVTKLSQLDLIRQLIELFRKRADYLIIRHHPFLIGTKENPPNIAFISELMKLADSAPPNVRIIMPQDSLITYDILPHLDAALASWSTVSNEAAFRGVASAVFPESHSSPAAYRLIDDLSAEGLSHIIQELYDATAECNLQILERCFRFATTYIDRLDFEFRSFGIDKSYEPGIKFKAIEELLPGNDPALDRIVDHLISNSPLHKQPAESQLANPAAEREILTAHRKELLEKRGARRNEPFPPYDAQVEIVAMCQINNSLLYRQRLKNTFILTIPFFLSPQSDSNILVETIKNLENSTSKYLHFAAVSARYEEHFLSTAVEYMTKNDCSWTSTGAWILGNNGEIRGEFLTRRFHLSAPSDIDEFKTISPELSAHLLTTFVFSKDAGLQMLKALKKGSMHSDLLNHLLTLLHSKPEQHIAGPNLGFY